MPTETTQPVRAYAHCPDPQCPGGKQEQVDAIRVETTFTYADNGGDGPGIERSMISLRYADAPADAACSFCSRSRELTDQVRRRYDALSGHPADGLLILKGMG